MKHAWLAGIALAIATASPALAHHGAAHSDSSWEDQDDGDYNFSLGTLNGPYVFQATGFADDGKPGELSFLGTITFDGNGGVTDANLIMTHGDSVQASCSDIFDIIATPPAPVGNGSYTFNNPGGTPGQYSMVLPLVPNPSASPAVVNAGSLNFGILVSDPSGNSGNVIETDNGTLSGVQVCGVTINSLDLKGTLTRVGEGGD
jgi:hypothetical protein